MSHSKKFRIATLGCRTNQYESQAYRNQLEAIGYSLAENDDIADICIINTCTVTENADKDSRYQIRQLAKNNPGAKIVVTGCSAEKSAEAIRKIEGVTDVIPNTIKEKLIEQLFPEEEVPEFSIKRFPSNTRAFVKVQDGCNSFCSYCIIPYVRGRSRSRTILEVVKEVEDLVANGYKEVVLTGINIGDFDGGKKRKEGPDRLVDLVRAVDAVIGLERLRISSIDPDEIDDELIQTVLNGKTTCNSMHVVLQSGSNAVLKRMNRKYTSQIFLDTIDRLKLANQDFTFTTDVIVGFPGEQEQDFEDTVNIIKEVQFARVHMFPYSERSGTKAATFTDKVLPEIMKKRKLHALHVAEQVAYELREKYVGRTMSVLTERGDGNVCGGHTENFLYVQIPNAYYPPNTLVQVKLIANNAESLVGEPILAQSV